MIACHFNTLILTLAFLSGVIMSQSSITAQCGEDVTLSCTFPTLGLAANQQVNVTWKKPRADGPDLLVHSYSLGMEKQSEAYRGRTQLDPEGFAKGDASLRLRDVHIQDEGSYSCFVNSELGPWSEETSLTVLSMIPPTMVQEGEDITLSCSFEPERNLQLLNITWKKETAEGRDLLVHTYYNGRDQMLRQNKAYLGRTQLYPERFHEGIASLRLKNVQLADDGVYTCHVKPQLGVSGEETAITAQYGKDVTLTCIFPSKFKISFHRLSITWTKEGAQGQGLLVHRFYLKMNWREGQEEAYRGRTQLYPQEFPQGNASLRLSDVRLQDEGSYLCNVSCELGSWSQKISLIVLSTVPLPVPRS
uniref:Ig-like domain-containing protein n=1 Tax=Terrapene triunguis TaxID=2587831 RepID=A0A674IRN2_9SAUR